MASLITVSSIRGCTIKPNPQIAEFQDIYVNAISVSTIAIAVAALMVTVILTICSTSI